MSTMTATSASNQAARVGGAPCFITTISGFFILSIQHASGMHSCHYSLLLYRVRLCYITAEGVIGAFACWCPTRTVGSTRNR